MKTSMARNTVNSQLSDGPSVGVTLLELCY